MDKSTAFINGKIYTMKSEGNTCDAFVVRDGKFIYCGGSEEAAAMADEVVDLKGSPVIPGMIDTHQHLYFYAECLTKLALEDVRSLQELKQVIRKHAESLPEGAYDLVMQLFIGGDVLLKHLSRFHEERGGVGIVGRSLCAPEVPDHDGADRQPEQRKCN